MSKRYHPFRLESGLSGFVIVWPDGTRSELHAHTTEEDARLAMQTMQDAFDLGARSGERATADLLKARAKGGVQ